MGAHVVVSMGRHFETARVTQPAAATGAIQAGVHCPHTAPVSAVCHN
jgi:hypothetical protein